jgi:hypothetical protein
MADTAVSAFTAGSALAGTELIPMIQGGTDKTTTPDAIKTYFGSPMVHYVLSAQVNNSTVTAAAVTGWAVNGAGTTLTVGIGTFVIEGWIVYQTAATTTGIEMFLDHTGTVSRVMATFTEVTTATSAATGVGDQSTTATAQYVEGKAQRADNTATGTTQGVDTANSSILKIMDALVTVTVSGTLNLMFRSEVAASQASIMQGSVIRVTKVA